MKLSEYLERENISQAEFGSRINTSQGAVAKYASGNRVPTPVVMQRIRVATNGAVTPNDFFPEVETTDVPFQKGAKG